MDKLDEVEAEKADNSEEEVNKLYFSSIAIFLGGKNIYFELIYFWFFSFIFVCIFFLQCIVCESNKATMQTFPCTHQVVCRTCFVRTIQTTVANRKLPLR